ncbi:hypothetical protein J41TS12_34220 [Paenibacillus antibioticophila]|uniref:EAL domain-containing protein n=1 Tax=Paenibacillus antibioticophila TaxID=1274374 RepID=A0A920CFT3_9BACL|nr:EAL domain-containing protein [Paenibacillus antibioticophila]GIO38561.1 hypothetical protein J41TS12_34220 [Paenibacillus antibioticophila]
MNVRTEEKTAVIHIGLGLLVIISLFAFFENFENFGDTQTIQVIQLVGGLICGAVAFAIFAQGWIWFAEKLSKHRFYTAILFIVLAGFSFLLAMGPDGVGVSDSEMSTRLSNVCLVISHLICAVGMLAIFSASDNQITKRYKVSALLGTAVGSAALLLLLFSYQQILPKSMLELGSFPQFKLAIWIITMLLYSAGIAGVMYHHRKAKTIASLTVVRALLFMMMGYSLLLTGDPAKPSFYHMIGQWYMAISYYFVLKGVYQLTILEPFRVQQQIEARMKHMAYHDDLTGLPNIRRLKETLAGMLSTSSKTSELKGVAVVNIDRFKAINDSLGYSTGDLLLKELGKRLEMLCTEQERVYRLGDDEFALIFTGLTDSRQLENRAEQLLCSVNPSITIVDTEYHVSLSMGLAIFPYDAKSVDHLIQYADMAVHYAKERDVTFLRYSEDMKLRTQARVELENDMRKALDREEFFLEFQPQFNLLSGKMVGMEALVRWNHPKRGLLPPNEFIPIAEESGLIVPLGEWVLKTACGYNRRWQLEGFDPVCISVNLSMRQFRQYNLAEKVDSILKEVGLEAHYLELEVTESMTFDIETALNQLESLKKLGVHISIDDFGTGYSSLNYLKSLPIDRLKIDRSFVREVMIDGNDAAIVSTITMMAHHLKLKVTAEGVESKEQLEFLKQQNCHEGQGYLFSKPVKAEELRDHFLNRKAG